MRAFFRDDDPFIRVVKLLLDKVPPVEMQGDVEERHDLSLISDLLLKENG
jgi:hypothetical protein